MNKVCVIIVNWNGKEHLQKCLPSLQAQSYTDCQIIVVDNGSTDGSVDYIKQSFPNIKIIQLNENRLFAGGNNAGIQEAFKYPGIKYIALLNNDTIAEKNYLSEMMRVMENNPHIGICASKMLSMNNPRNIDSTGHIFGRWGAIIERGHNEVDNGQYDNKLEVVGACAGACLYRRTMLEDIGLFDEGFKIYYEDAELSWRAYKKGWPSRYVPRAIVYHKRGASSESKRAIRHNNRLLLLRNEITTVKRYGSISQKYIYGFRLLLELIQSLYFHLIKAPKNIGITGYLTGLRYFFSKKS